MTQLRGRLFTAADLAPVLEWSQLRTKRWMVNSGIAFKMGKLWYTSRERLISKAPEVWSELADSFAPEDRD